MASTDDRGTPDPQVEPRSTGPRRYSAEYKARILAEYETLDRQGKGALLRREGLYSSLITTWREQRDRGAKTALAAPAGRPKADPRDTRRSNCQFLWITAGSLKWPAAIDRGPRSLRW
ncbi:hypothetical protein ACIOWI_37690 [Streptomyces sp. NPDC087659]|uniref:hypothetical protein n=1 Tax=Streptomyces sp. NPDC087659 TaxID=3365801 RepID=UPI00380F2024